MVHYYSQVIRDRLEKNSNSARSLSSRARARAARAIERAEFEYTNIRLEQTREPNELLFCADECRFHHQFFPLVYRRKSNNPQYHIAIFFKKKIKIISLGLWIISVHHEDCRKNISNSIVCTIHIQY